MTKWELARYLLDAKKSVDSIMYIADVLPELEHIPVRAYVNSNRQTFYICCCVLLDNVYLSKKEKQAIRSKDSIVTEVYYQRDKNYAHKDKDYEAVAYDSLNTMAAEMREQLLHIATVCKNHLPPEVTLDFIPYDRILFRMVSGITKAVEDEIYKSRYARLNTPNDGITFPLFNDTEDIKSVDDNNRSQYAVLIQDGLNIYEGLQNRQDSCVRVNVLHNQHIWCQITQASLEQMRELYGTVFKECGCQPKNPVGRIVLELELRGEEP